MLVDFFVIALWNLLKYEQNFVHRLVHTAPFAKNLSKLGAIRPEMKTSTTRHIISWVEESPSQQPPWSDERFFALLQWPKNRVGLQAPLSSTNRRAGAKRVPAGGRKSASGPEIAFPGCVHAHSGSFWGGHLKYYINWRTKFQGFGWWNFRRANFFCVWRKNFPPTLTLLVRHHSQNTLDTKSSQMCLRSAVCVRIKQFVLVSATFWYGERDPS